MVSKFGKKFEDISKLFDHAAHNGSNYLNGHCFVSVMLCIPVWNKNKISYLSLPLGYRMWQKEKGSKLELAASMVRQVMPEFRDKKNVIILCDSWYVKQNLVSIVDDYENLCAAWSNSLEISSNFFPNFETMVSSMQRNTGWDFRLSGTRPRASFAVAFIKPEKSTLA